MNNQSIAPVLPSPAAMIVNFDPAAESKLSFENLHLFRLAYSVFAAGPVIGRDFCMM